MKATITIQRGTRYDPMGVIVTHGSLRALFTADGKLESGDMPPVWTWDKVQPAIARVSATGEAETLVLGIDAPRVRVASIECGRYDPDLGCPLHGEACK